MPPENRVAVVAPMTADRCPLAYGLTSLKQAFINKHDFARLHSYEFHSRPVVKDPAVPGTWYRLQLIKQVRWRPPRHGSHALHCAADVGTLVLAEQGGTWQLCVSMQLPGGPRWAAALRPCAVAPTSRCQPQGVCFLRRSLSTAPHSIRLHDVCNWGLVAGE